MTDLQSILDGDHRSAEHRARDSYRHPAEVLEFWSLRPNHTVVDIWPGSKGWTTEILAPYLRDNGCYVAANYDPPTETSFDATESQASFEKKLADCPELYDKVQMGRISPSVFDLGPENSADRVVAFRVHHIFMAGGYLDALTDACLRVLKPGGIFGVVEHREAEDRPHDPKASRGYVHQSFIVEATTARGFVLDGTSEVNANPKDTKDYPQAVWSLPPWMWGVTDEERQTYLAIGESDRMTLKFRKP